MLKALAIIFIISFSALQLYSQVNQEWARTYDGPSHGMDLWYSTVIDNSNNIYITGISEGICTIKYNSSGELLWVTRYKYNNLDSIARPNKIAIGFDGSLYISGVSTANNSRDVIIIKYSTVGIMQWVRRYPQINYHWDYPHDMCIDRVGNIILTGNTTDQPFDSINCITIKFDSDGQFSWSASYNAPQNMEDEGSSLVCDLQNNIYLTGMSIYSNSKKYFTLKYNFSGVQQWVDICNGFPHTDFHVSKIALDSIGNIIVTFPAYDSVNTYIDFVTVKYNSNGNRLWFTKYITNDGNVPSDLGVDNSGNVFVTGFDVGYVGTGNGDMITVKYNQN